MNPETIFPYILNTAHSASIYTSFLTTKLFSLSAPLQSSLKDGSNRDLTNIVLLLVIIYLSLTILDLTTRWIRNLVRLIMALIFWGTVAFVGYWAYQSGPDEVMKLLHFWGKMIMEACKKGRDEGWEWGTEGSTSGGWEMGS